MSVLERYRRALVASGVTPPAASRSEPDGATRPRSASRAEAASDAPAFLVFSRILGESVWLVEDDAHAVDLERELAAEGDHRLIFTVAEVAAMVGMIQADMRTVAGIKRRLRPLGPSRIEGVPLRGDPIQ